MSFAERLKKQMDEKYFTVTELANRTGICKSSISQYLSGKNIPGNGNLSKICNVLNVPVHFFSDGFTQQAETVKEQKNISVKRAAFMLGKSEQFIRVGLQKKILPFGSAVKVSGSKYTYHISPYKLNEYMGVST